MGEGETQPGPGALREILEALAEAARPIVAFDRIEIAVLQGPDSVRFATLEGQGLAPELESVAPRARYSEPLWPAAPQRVQIEDTTRELDPSHEGDRELLACGARSVLGLPLEVGMKQVGSLWLASRTEGALSSSAARLSPVLGLSSLAIERARLLRDEQERRLRREKLEALLPTIAKTLDVREVLPHLSAIIQDVLPHDTFSFALLEPDGSGVRVQAATNFDVRELPEYRFSSEQERVRADWKCFVAHDLNVLEDGVVRARLSPAEASEPLFVDLRPGPGWSKLVTDIGLRSSLRVPIRTQDGPIGGVAFSSRRAFAYGPDDVEVAARIADHVALSLAHQGLADEARRSARAEERAAQLELRVEALSEELERYSAHRALGTSPPWKRVLAEATKVAATETTVLITGESGTGKEVVARYIHRGSRRAQGPFVALNCAALPEQLLESELFGHERGAFTGALGPRQGRIEQAAGGVLFLDEVGEMSPAVQAKFLRVLQEREFQRVGGTRTLKADVRVLAATNREPRAAMAQGTLREDLYYRLSAFEISLPPLRERREDILLLVEAFLAEIGSQVGRPAAGISEDARELLLAHPWPGNVRELRNAVERAVILCDGGLVTREHLPIALGRPSGTPNGNAPATIPEGGLEAVERDLLQKALASAGHNKSRAARLLGLPRGTFYSLLRRHGLSDAKR